jgi:hypothetical protein
VDIKCWRDAVAKDGGAAPCRRESTAHSAHGTIKRPSPAACPSRSSSATGSRAAAGGSPRRRSASRGSGCSRSTIARHVWLSSRPTGA